mmetsp:Transcript_13646/g.19670  ORF Transcript_13646/g.19670 Transcript_13646/m.19670 type:complete len:219 (+) Transcript_13646:433-1089(+)
MACAVCDGVWDTAFHQNTLWCDTTGMKDGDLIAEWIEFNGISPVGFMNIGNPNGLWPSHADGSTVCVGETGSDLDFLGDVECRDGFHRNDHVARERTGGSAWKISVVHGNILALLGTAEWDASLEEGTIIGKTASDQKGNSVVWPIICGIRNFGNEFSVFVDGVFWNICSEIGLTCDSVRVWVSVADFDEGAGLFVALTKEQEIEGFWALRQDDEVTL